jgi:predicted nucleic acid-binding protein
METRAIHLDTSFLIRALIPGSEPDQALRGWLQVGRLVSMSSVAWTELLCGPLDAEERRLAEQIVERRIPFDERDAESAAELFNATGRRRGSLIDCMIAAAAQRRGALLATLNPDHFRRFEDSGLRLAT